jgi:mRNA-degrading endonuclease RelE of RelBE toxin-antitoxin system
MRACSRSWNGWSTGRKSAVSSACPASWPAAGWCRLRTGDYRVRFQVEGENVVVDKIGHRREFYED